MFFYFKFELVKPVSWKKICLKYFSLQKIDKNTPFVQKQPSEVFLKKKFSKLFSKLKGKHLCCSLFFDKNTGLRPATLIRKRLQQRCFAVNFVNFSRTPFLQNTFRHLSHSFILQRNFIYLFEPSVRKILKNSRFYHLFIL